MWRSRGRGPARGPRSGASWVSSESGRPGSGEVRLGAESVRTHTMPTDKCKSASRETDPGVPLDSTAVLAGVYGNRTHQGRLAPPLTGFEDQADHQIGHTPVDCQGLSILQLAAIASFPGAGEQGIM